MICAGVSDILYPGTTGKFMYLLRPNPEGFVFMSWKEREGGGMEGRKQ